MTKIALIYSAYPPLFSWQLGDGGANSCRILARSLFQQGSEVHVITSRLPPGEPLDNLHFDNGVIVHRVMDGWGVRAILKGGISRLRSILATIAPDAILIVFPGGGVGSRYILPSLVKIARPGTPLATLVFALVPGRAPHFLPLFLGAELFLLLTSSALCFESYYHMELACRLFPFLRKRSRVIPTGCPISVPRHYSPEVKRACRERLALDQDARYIGFLGVWLRNKNVGLLLKSLRGVLESNREARVLFVGGRDREQMTSRYERRTLRMLLRLGFEDRAVFTGHVDEAALLDYLLCCDVCVLPFTDALGRSTMFLAMSAGMPIVTMSNGEHTYFKHGESAYLVPAGKEAALGQGIGSLLTDDRLQARLSAGALAVAREFSWENLSPQWAALFRGLPASKNGARAQVPATTEEQWRAPADRL